MSDAGRYRKVYPRVWRHTGFRKLTKSARELALYLLTGPQTNRVGLFHFSIATAAEDLDVGVETLRERLRDVQATFGWLFDADARVIFIPSWWRWNRPENANVLRGNLKDLSEIPHCGLVDAFARNLGTLPETLHQTFVEGCLERIGERSPIQDQDQDQKQEQEQEQARAARRAHNSKAHPDRLLSITSSVIDDLKSKWQGRAMTQDDRDEVIDHVAWELLQTKPSKKVPRSEIDAAINDVLSRVLLRTA